MRLFMELRYWLGRERQRGVFTVMIPGADLVGLWEDELVRWLGLDEDMKYDCDECSVLMKYGHVIAEQT